MNPLRNAPKYFRSSVIRSRPQGVVREGGQWAAGLIRGFSVITRGEALGHDLWINRDFLRKTADAINIETRGIKSRFSHPTLSGDGVGKQLGKVVNAEVSGERVLADLHFSTAAHKTPDGDLADYLLTLATDMPDSFGASIAFMPGDPMEASDSKNEAELPEVQLDGLIAVDIVDEPAANPEGLFSRGQEIALDLDAIANYAFGVTKDRPKGMRELDLDIDRAVAWAKRWMAANHVQITTSKGDNQDDVKSRTALMGQLKAKLQAMR